MEVMVDTNIGSSLLVDPKHVLMKCWTVSVMIIIPIGNEQKSVNHLVKQGLHKIFPRPKFEQRNT